MAGIVPCRSACKRANPARATESGFAYLVLLILLTILGMVGTTALHLGAVSHRRSAEQALLDIGTAFGDALESYRKVTPAGQPSAPTSLQELLRDPRFAAPVRHLRQLYADPITGATEWATVTERGRPGIIGIHSLSRAKPIKVGNFGVRFQEFTGKTQYADWVFFRNRQTGAAETAPVAAAAPAGPLPAGGDAALGAPGTSLFGPSEGLPRAAPLAPVPVTPSKPDSAAPAGAAPSVPAVPTPASPAASPADTLPAAEPPSGSAPVPTEPEPPLPSALPPLPPT